MCLAPPRAPDGMNNEFEVETELLELGPQQRNELPCWITTPACFEGFFVGSLLGV